MLGRGPWIRGEPQRIVSRQDERSARPEHAGRLHQRHGRILFAPEEHRAVEAERGRERALVQRQGAQVALHHGRRGRFETRFRQEERAAVDPGRSMAELHQLAKVATVSTT